MTNCSSYGTKNTLDCYFSRKYISTCFTCIVVGRAGLHGDDQCLATNSANLVTLVSVLIRDGSEESRTNTIGTFLAESIIRADGAHIGVEINSIHF